MKEKENFDENTREPTLLANELTPIRSAKYYKKIYKNINFTKNCTLFAFFGGFLIFILTIVGLFFVVLYGIVPCHFKQCHLNATCINRPFNAKCKCKPGFNGNGIECDECGRTFPGEQTHGGDLIYPNDGNLVTPFTFPSTVHIRFRYFKLVTIENGVFSAGLTRDCLGILINRLHVLTAASCIPKNISFTPYFIGPKGRELENKTIHVPVEFYESFPDWKTIAKVFYGIDDYIYYGSEITPTKRAHVKDIIIPENYNEWSLDYDLAVVILAQPVNLTNYVQLACIPHEDDLPFMQNYLVYDTPAYTLGWDMYSSVERGSTFVWHFTVFDLNLFQVSNCSGMYPHTPDLDQLICAGAYPYLNEPWSAPQNSLLCQGFPGSPLIVKRNYNGDVKSFSIGIAINDTVCGLGVFANLFFFVEWLSEVTDY